MLTNATNSAGHGFRYVIMALTLAVTLLFSALFFTMDVNADGGIDWGSAIQVTQNGQVVDSITMNGQTVQAIYAPRGNVSGYDSDGTYCCAAFVKRFYKNVYGVDVWNLYPCHTPSVIAVSV